MNNKIIITTLLAAVFLSGCMNFVTRRETDVYTISVRDSVDFIEQKNAPGNRDNGVVFPSSRTIQSNRSMIQRDSVVERDYPDFIRLGIFESVSLIGGDSKHALGNGLFGIFHDFDNLKSTAQGDSSSMFTGGIYRIGIGEWRLRWFKDAANWTIGTHLMESIMPDARVEMTLSSVLPLYIRKRYYLSEKIPYISLTASLGIGYYPSQYLNLSGSFDIGSLGGLNLRAYAGLAAGISPKGSYTVRISNVNDKSQTVVLPYAGIGISFLDFLNLVPETLDEWKQHKNSAWNIGILQAGLIGTGAVSAFSDSGNTTKQPITGFYMRLLNTSLALPFLNNQFYIGTSLANLMILGKNEMLIGMLPLRIGYWQTILADELSLEPFFELGYYPSNYINLGGRLNLRLSELTNLGLILGYASGESTRSLGTDLTNEFGDPVKTSRVYLGISVGVGDRIFYPEEIRYNK